MIESVGTQIKITGFQALAKAQGTASVTSPKTPAITEEGMAALKTIEKGLDELRAADLNFARQRLSAVRQRIAMTQNMLGMTSDPAMQGKILKGAAGIGRELQGIATQIRTMIGLDPGFAASLTQYDAKASIATISASRSTLALYQDKGGLSIERTTEKVEAVVASLQVQKSRTLYWKS